MKSTTPSDPVQDAWRTLRIASAAAFLALPSATAVVVGSAGANLVHSIGAVLRPPAT